MGKLKIVGELDPEIHVELLLLSRELVTDKTSEVLIMLFPLASSKDTMNCEPAMNGTKSRGMPAEKLIFSRGITVTVELKGRNAKEAGAPEGDESNPVKESRNGEHCTGLVVKN